jgi:hypothetical protein
VRPLQVQPLAGRVGGHQHLRAFVGGEHLLRGAAGLPANPAVDGRSAPPDRPRRRRRCSERRIASGLEASRRCSTVSANPTVLPRGRSPSSLSLSARFISSRTYWMTASYRSRSAAESW